MWVNKYQITALKPKNKTKQNKTKQNKTKQNNQTKQNKRSQLMQQATTWKSDGMAEP